MTRGVTFRNQGLHFLRDGDKEMKIMREYLLIIALYEDGLDKVINLSQRKLIFLNRGSHDLFISL